ncbi:MAG: hypothetical protein PVF96_00920 [Candidatus Bathyarchaeota archaeon]|jgi:predicted regulator of Ras-like GTPase activity (Roadblock/LC7/MglB family)
MVKKDKKNEKNKEINEVIHKSTANNEESVEKLRENLEEIKTYEGVIGYIMRNSTSAAIDLKDPTKIIDYAILSSSAIEVGEEIPEDFKLGTMESIIVEGKDAKILSLKIDENKTSVFMEKKIDHQKILKKLHST